MNAIPTSTEAVIFGGGISGLVIAHHFSKRGISFVLLEASHRTGGAVRSEWKDGFLLEYGPNTVTPTEELMDLLHSLDLDNDVLLADPRATRYVQWSGRLHPVPMSPGGLFKTKLLSRRGLLRLMAEPFILKRRTDGDESLYDFCMRRLGSEATDRLVSPFVSGVWAGDAHQLSAEGAFPKLVQAEKQKGSILRGMIAQRKAQKNGHHPPPKGLLSFKNGLETLTTSLFETLKENLFLNTWPDKISRDKNEWVVSGSNFSCRTRKIIFTSPAWATSNLIDPLSGETAETLRQIPYASLAVLHIGIEKAFVNHSLSGFGYLIAPKEGSEVLGCLWNSSLFPKRTPDGQALMTVFIGGARHGNSVNKPDETLFDVAFQTLNPVLGFRKRPRLINLTRYEKALPQYTLGHGTRIKAIQNFEAANPGLRFAGNYLRGVSVGDVIRQATAIGQEN